MQVPPTPASDTDDTFSPPAASDPWAKLANRRILELGLFQYYILTVAPSFPYYDRDQGSLLHAQLVPQAALRFPGLLNTLYAYTLLHMYVQTRHEKLPINLDFFEEQGIEMRGGRSPELSRVNLLTIHSAYLDLALREQRNSVVNITRENGDGICLAAIWLGMISLVHSSQVVENQDYKIPSQWFVLQVSFSMCLETARPLLGMDSATGLVVHGAPTIDNRNLDVYRSGLFRDLLDWQPSDHPEVMDASARQAYELSVAYLQTIHKRITEGEDSKLLGRRILAFPSVPSSRFVSLLTEHRPRALAILATLLALTKRLETTWWIFEGVADRHVLGLARLVPDEWSWAMAWPLMVLQDGQSLRGFVE